ncbi:ISKra4 family transposase [Candidatus Parcubacteria bacterium]|nr:MAG: ISKra4 family transposase [Candidatus Parcubacteria bacterium]
MSCLRASISQVDDSWHVLIIAIEKAPSLGEMMLAAWQLARQMAVTLVEETLAERAARPTRWPQCTQCGTPLESKGLVERCVTGLIGTVRWKRRVGRCPNGCPIGHGAPLDIEIGLQAQQRTSAARQRAACALAVFVPFTVAAVLLHLLTGAMVSPGAIWQWVQSAGHRARQDLDRQLEALAAGQFPQEEPLDATTAALPLLIGTDGVMVPFRPQEGQPHGRTRWQEVKVGVLARLGWRVTQTGKRVSHLVRRRLVAVRGSRDDLEPRLWLEAMQQGVLSAKQVVWLSDGGRGFWELFYDYFAGYAVGILDCSHAAQNLWKAARAWLDGRTHRARQWFTGARRRLRDGDVDTVLEDLVDTLVWEDLPASARQTLENVYVYLARHRNYIDYARYRALGFPLGSGMVESACKWLIQQRFKGVGMRWSEEGFHHLLLLRLAWVNGRFDALFTFGSSPNS